MLKKCSCGAGCVYEKESEPCYGKVMAIEEIQEDDGGWFWIHVCDGHEGVWDGGKYVPPPKEVEKPC